MSWVGSAPPCGGQVPTWGHGPCTNPWWRRALLVASLEQELPLYHPPVTDMLVWHVGTRPHVAHRQSLRWADSLGRLSSLNFGSAVSVCPWPFGSDRTTTLPCDGASCTCRDRGLLAGWLAGTSLAIALFLPHSPMRKLLPLAGNEEVLQDGHWVGLLLAVIVLTSTLAACLAPPVT